MNVRARWEQGGAAAADAPANAPATASTDAQARAGAEAVTLAISEAARVDVVWAAPQPVVARIKVWDLPTRLFHWSLVAAFTVAVVSGELGGEWMALHGKAGLAIVGLVAFRLVWGVAGSTYARFATFLPTPSRLRAYAKGRWDSHGHNPLGGLSVLALLLFLGVQVGSGLFANDEIAFTGPLFALIGEDLALTLTGWHRQLSWALFALVGLHVAAILAYLQFKKRNLIGPMVTGWKAVRSADVPATVADQDDAHQESAGKHPTSSAQASKPSIVALLLALAVGAGAVVLASGVWIPEPPPAPVQQSTTPAW